MFARMILRPGGAYLLRQKRLDRGLGTDWHERRSLDDSMPRCHPAAAGAADVVDRRATRIETDATVRLSS